MKYRETKIISSIFDIAIPNTTKFGLFCIFVSYLWWICLFVGVVSLFLLQKFNLPALSDILYDLKRCKQAITTKNDCINPFNLILMMEWQTIQQKKPTKTMKNTHFQWINWKTKWKRRKKLTASFQLHVLFSFPSFIHQRDDGHDVMPYYSKPIR